MLVATRWRRSPMLLLLEAVCLALVVGAIGLIGLLVAQPLIAPSIASAAFVQVLTPTQPNARVWPIFAGQVAGLLGALAGVYAVGAVAAPPLETGHPLLLLRVAAVALSVFVAALLQRAIKSPSPAGAATAALIALGTERATLAGCLRVFAAIVLVTALGEAARVLILRFKRERDA